jgi:hypothetical protein
MCSQYLKILWTSRKTQLITNTLENLATSCVRFDNKSHMSLLLLKIMYATSTKPGKTKLPASPRKTLQHRVCYNCITCIQQKKVHEKDIDIPSPAGVPISPNRHRRPSITSMGMHQLRKVIYDKECSLVVKQVIHNDDALFCIVHILFRRCTYTL